MSLRGRGLVDRSERGKLALTGAEAKAFLNGQVSNEIEALAPGEGCYAALLTHKGKMLGDLRVIDIGDELLLLTERAALQALFDASARGQVGFDVELHKRTLERGLLSLIGPRARDVAGADADGPGRDRARQRARRDRRRGGALIGPTPGIDVLCDGADTDVCARALQAGGAVAVSDEAAPRYVRVEQGRPRYGVDLDDSVIPRRPASTSAR